MDWVLHDPEHGAYGSGRLTIGPAGDFVTAPSLAGGDFAALLATQVLAWLQELADCSPGTLSLVEAGPGEGTLALALAEQLREVAPELAKRLELVLVEPNPGLAARQRRRLTACPLTVRWSTFAALAQEPVVGVLLAHEVLDALAVSRFVRHGDQWCTQQVALEGDRLVLRPGPPLATQELQQLQTLGLDANGRGRPEGWCSERHPGVAPWLAEASAAIGQGRLLVIDYALEAWRYYAPQRSNGTLLAYRRQVASPDPLQSPGAWDLTAHLCIDSLVADAAAHGWQRIGERRQGEALLALGLAQRLHALQQDTALDSALQRRESLLRLVDPGALGEFRWLAFRRGSGPQAATISAADCFLHDPPLA